MPVDAITAPATPSALIITGPTGIGKTELAVRLARRRPLEIISADSMQVYRGMPIGTAQPSEEERRQATFHLCGVLEPSENFDVQQFLDLSDAARRQALGRGRQPIYVGGTGLYLRALRWGLFDQASRDDAVRAGLEGEAARLGAPALHERLVRIDPEAAARIMPNDAIRIVRALEVQATTGRRLSELQRQWERPRPRFPHVLVVLIAPREVMRERIARRTDAMLAAGWVEEVEALLRAGVAPERHCFKALGYREIIRHLRGELSRGEMRELIVNQTRQFARRQIVWFRRERPALWLSTGGNEPAALAGQLENLLEKLMPPPV